MDLCLSSKLNPVQSHCDPKRDPCYKAITFTLEINGHYAFVQSTVLCSKLPVLDIANRIT